MTSAQFSLLLVTFTSVLSADPGCQSGILDSDSIVCCAHECGHCGGTSCQNLPGGSHACCSRAIQADGNGCADHDAPCVMPPPSPTPAPPPTPLPPLNRKRGFVADDVKALGSCDTPLLLNTSGWFYDYNGPNPYRQAGLKGDCSAANASTSTRFTPMNWCLSSINHTVPNDVSQQFWMGFNEPNNVHNCHTSPADVARAWARVMELHPNSKLVSPATAGNGIAWYDQFFGNCTALYGASGCRISYLATHDYSCSPASTLAYLKQLYDRYGYPVWLTEFSCGDHADGRPTSAHIAFMREVLPLLDAADYVYRYAWMSTHDASGMRGLVELNAAGRVQLTELGKIWNGELAHGE